MTALTVLWAAAAAVEASLTSWSRTPTRTTTTSSSTMDPHPFTTAVIGIHFSSRSCVNRVKFLATYNSNLIPGKSCSSWPSLPRLCRRTPPPPSRPTAPTPTKPPPSTRQTLTTSGPLIGMDFAMSFSSNS